MIPTPSTPPPAALGESPLVVPRGPDVDLARTVDAAEHWPPVPVARLDLRQAWLPQPEAALRPGHVGLAATACSVVNGDASSVFFCCSCFPHEDLNALIRWEHLDASPSCSSRQRLSFSVSHGEREDFASIEKGGIGRK